jgi:dihydrofolate reductase
MRKLIAGINMTLDGFCDHTAISPDETIHHHYSELLRQADTILYGRITYQLMEYWRDILQNPTGIPSMDDFAVAIDSIHKIVFSNTLKNTDWKTAQLAKHPLKEEVLALKQQAGKDILVGSPSLIVSLMNLHLIDELQLCIHPVIIGKGLPLFKNIQEKVHLELFHTKTFDGGAIILYYKPTPKD